MRTTITPTVFMNRTCKNLERTACVHVSVCAEHERCVTRDVQAGHAPADFVLYEQDLSLSC